MHFGFRNPHSEGGSGSRGQSECGSDSATLVTTVHLTTDLGKITLIDMKDQAKYHTEFVLSKQPNKRDNYHGNAFSNIIMCILIGGGIHKKCDGAAAPIQAHPGPGGEDGVEVGPGDPPQVGTKDLHI